MAFLQFVFPLFFFFLELLGLAFDFLQGNLEEIRLRYQAEAQRDCYRAMTLALSKRLGLEDSVPQITLLPPEKED